MQNLLKKLIKQIIILLKNTIQMIIDFYVYHFDDRIYLKSKIKEFERLCELNELTIVDDYDDGIVVYKDFRFLCYINHKKLFGRLGYESAINYLKNFDKYRNVVECLSKLDFISIDSKSSALTIWL